MDQGSDRSLLAPVRPPEQVDVARELFPLRLTPFEYYFLLEDRAHYPSVFPVRLECRGTLERGAFDRALRIAHARHPLLSARIGHRPGRRPIWLPGEPTSIAWSADGGVTGSSAAHGRPGVEIRIAQQGDASILTFLFHHVAVDGMGAFQFISDLFLAYAHACSGAEGEPRWSVLRTELLRDRDGHRLFNRRVRLVDITRMYRVMLPLLVQRAAVIDPHGQSPDPGAGAATDFLLHTFDEHESRQISRAARRLSVRLHDLLLRDYFLTLADWNRGTSQERRPLRVLVPMNMRRKQDYRMPAANVFGYAFLTRSMAACGAPEQLLCGLQNEMSKIKRTRWAVYHEAGMRLFSAWPALLRWSLNRKWPFATAIFTNLNAGFDHVPLPCRDGRRVAGDLTIEAGYGAGPIRPETRVSVAAHRYAGRLSITLRGDSTVLSRAAQQEMLDNFLNRLRETAGLH
ncbi:MAG TPA: hypothetical protein VL175_00385 [Pirellulales bacterium]|jgi:hypothetical protein|nr:hypothetical protein [Pirellulales bacterium]